MGQSELANNVGKGIIFDLDGTLLDSMGVWQEIDNRFFSRRGIRIPADYAATVSTMQAEAIAEYTINRFRLAESVQQIVDEWNADAQELYAARVVPKPHASEYLEKLTVSGARLAVATSLEPRIRDSALQHTGLARYFECVCSLEDACSLSKEEPDIYLKACSRISLDPSDCFVFEDSLTAIKTVKKTGMRVWAVYEESSAEDWPEIQQLADGSVTDFAHAPLVFR